MLTPKASLSIFLLSILLLLLAACATPIPVTPTPPELIRDQPDSSSTVVYIPDYGDPGPRPPTVEAPTGVYQPAPACQVFVELAKHDVFVMVHDDKWSQSFLYIFRLNPTCFAAACTCPHPVGTPRPSIAESSEYEIHLPGVTEISPGEMSCPSVCDENGRLIFEMRLQASGMYAVYLGEQLIGYLDVPTGQFSSSGPPPETTSQIGAPTFTLPPGTTYPLPEPPRSVPSTPNPLWTPVPTIDPSAYPPPPPGSYPIPPWRTPYP